MRETIKNILGLLIVATISYVTFVSYSAYQFFQTDQALLSESLYKDQIEVFENDLSTIETKFNETNYYDSSKTINLNFDGTPKTWVVKITELNEEAMDQINDVLFNQGFLTFSEDGALFVGPYIDRSQLDFALELLGTDFGLDDLQILEWKI
ncbi:MAG: hypothetical protein O3C54_03970 [Proteobacteria bacterium]|uniref:Uncharacterized protein n=1 Tax=SAR86 cluster bacterium TaxID=2030880 RepID=A0A937IK19_9GAMM|nr:hypothetical protein [SAR86 cluster bacterium]MBL6820127.1 hypothetical protein [SAR86 cluster bacterium]MDA0345099.1 hypothetical protein [Pseudomonadota bacterium]MDA0900264.1 hypothetical protein [Pseudomonadota bacterium]MDA1056224.1 hypothetical protein [Pseudomonadota bacterium]